jgi:hypothetical protein
MEPTAEHMSINSRCVKPYSSMSAGCTSAGSSPGFNGSAAPM